MTVRGSCSCYGHADECVAHRPEDELVEGMIHGTCKCKHNTRGNNCEWCLDNYNDAPWKPTIGKIKNELSGELFFVFCRCSATNAINC